MKFQINVAKLGLGKPITISPTIRNVRECMVAQKELAEYMSLQQSVDTESADEKKTIDFLNKTVEMLDTFINFLTVTLGLSEKQKAQLENSEMNDINYVVGEVTAKVLQYDDSKRTNKSSNKEKSKKHH